MSESDAYDDPIIRVDIGYLEALSIYVADYLVADKFVVLYERWDRTGGLAAEREIRVGDAEACVLALADAIRAYRENEIAHAADDEPELIVPWKMPGAGPDR